MATMKEANRLLSSEKEPQKGRNCMMSPMKLGTKADGFERKGQAWFVATELQSDLVVEVGGLSFHLHKFPLLSRSGRLNRLVFESRDTQKDHIKLVDMPGGAEAFELAAKFCYGVAVDLTASNIAALRCAAEYLEMTEDLEIGNLISKTEAFLSFVVLASWKDSITVLQSCENLSPWAENLQIVRRCSESIAWKACTDPRGIGWSYTGRDEAGGGRMSSGNSPYWNGSAEAEFRKVPQDWWFEDVSGLCTEHFVKVVTAIKAKGMRADLVGAAVVQYALRTLPGLGKEKNQQQQQQQQQAIMEEHRAARERQQAMMEDQSKQAMMEDHRLEKERSSNFRGVLHSIAEGGGGKVDFMASQSRNRAVLESIVALLPPQKDIASCSFLLRLLRMANMLSASSPSRSDLERRIGVQLEQASLDELLIPSFSHTCETLYDVELVQRIVEHFLLQDQTVPPSPAPSLAGADPRGMQLGNGGGVPRLHSAPYSAKMRVARLIDGYLTEVARDANLSPSKFQALAEALPEYARACDDGLYRAIDTYLKAHPGLSELERKRLCRVMDCQKLSLDACMHAAQNERLPLRIIVQVLFSEQVKLRNAITASALTRELAEPLFSAQGHQMRVDALENGSPSLQEGWSTARRDIKSIKLDVEKIKTKFVELQTDYSSLQQQLEKLSKPKGSGSSTPSSWASGLKKLSWLTPQFRQRRQSIDGDDSGAGNVIATPGAGADIHRPRRRRNSIS